MRILREILSSVGFLMAFYGLYSIYEPAAFVVAGVFLLWVSIQPRRGK